ncbi:LlaJI family restriction endonuclease [Flavonifractor sp. HCP28S3_F3]|uniref:LlaJI family restriction endonuclease n=1 Tax=Flavonifractor sp. HCP28S3_F3 TaxID=3438939 RepID=UPI003F899C45
MKIQNLKKIAATGKMDNQFIGIKISDNQIEFHYPETYQLSEDDDGLRRDILAILRTVSLAKTRTSDLSSYNTQHNNDYVFPLGAYLWIINDYLSYGRYENREKVYQRGARGKIDWKRTMRSNPVISDGNVIYTDIISEKKSQKDNLLTEIYFFCVQKAVDSIGWLYSISFDPNGVDYYKKFNKKLYLAALNTELAHTFDDQKKVRLQNMKNVIVGLDDDIISTREMIYGVDSYDYVYERMVDAMFSRVEDIRDFYPNATWDLVLEKGPVDSTNLRPDTVLIKDNKVYILDAKYYRYGTTFKPSDMPETTSIQKQITYGEYVKKVKEGLYDDVFSAFVLPYSKNQNAHKDKFDENMEFVGIAKAKWIDSEGESSRRIVAILVDTKFLITNWLKKNEDNISGIIDLIENNVGGVVRE